MNKLTSFLSKPGSPPSSNINPVNHSAFTPSAIGGSIGFQKTINSP
jgi:hypothetical protein